MSPSQTVAILGASNKPERYAYKSLKLLQEYGHQVIPVHPKLKTIEGVPVLASLRDIKTEVDTLTLYVSAERLLPLINDIIALKPGRVIFNPGTESLDLMSQLGKKGIAYERSCTLVLLRSGQF